MYQITSAELAAYRKGDKDFSVSALEPPFKAKDIVAFDAEPLGFTYYLKNGDVYTTSPSSDQLCGEAQSSYFKKLGRRRIRRYSPSSGNVGHIIDKDGTLHNCSHAQDVHTTITTLNDITDDGQLSRDGVLRDFGLLRAEENSSCSGENYLLFAGTFRAVVARKIPYEKSKLGLILGLALGLPLGLLLVALVVLLVLKKKGYFLKRPVTRADERRARKL